MAEHITTCPLLIVRPAVGPARWKGSRKVRRLNQLDRAEIPCCNSRRDHPLPILVELSILRVYYSVLNVRVLSRFKSQVGHLKLTLHTGETGSYVVN